MEKEFLEVSTLESKITSELAKENITEKVLVELKAKYGDLKLKSLDDKESYLELKEAAKVCSKVRNAVVKCCKLLREEAVAYQKKCVAKEKEIVSIVSEIEDPIDAEIAKYDAELNRKEEEEKQRKENEYMSRTQNLTKMGAVYSNNEFTLGEFSIEANLVKDCSQEVWESDMLPKFQEQYEIIEAVKIEEQKKKDAEAAELKRKQDELAEQQRKFQEEQAEFQRKQDEIARIEREKLAEETRQKELERTELQNSRLTALLPFNPTGEGVDMSTLWVLSESHFQEILANKKVEFQKKQEEYQKHIEEQAAIKERQRIAEEQRQAEYKRYQEEQRKAEELAKAGDKEKYQHLIEQFNTIVVPEMRSGQYRTKVALIREKLEEIKAL
jgi:hypothetical protein